MEYALGRLVLFNFRVKNETSFYSKGTKCENLFFENLSLKRQKIGLHLSSQSILEIKDVKP